MSYTLAVGGDGPATTAEVVWSVDGQTYNFRSDNNFIAWITTLFTVADVVAGGGLSNPLVLPDNSNPAGWSLNTTDSDGVGGSITLTGGDDGGQGGNITANGNGPYDAGAINLNAGLGASGGGLISVGGDGNNTGSGGILNLSGGPNGRGGYITSIGGSQDETFRGGDITLSGGDNGRGGDIISIGGGNGNGGSINLSDGGGSIDLTGQGSIEFGTVGQRTTLIGSADEDRTQTLPNASGTVAVINVGSLTHTFGLVPGNGGIVTTTTTVSGVALGEAVLVTCTTARTGGTGAVQIVFDGFVSATNTVTVVAHNPHNNNITLGSLDFKIIIFKGI